MRNYETTFIINPQSDDATIEKHVSDIKDIILKTEGKIISENHMGTRRLAYEINKLTQGYYATFIYEAPVEVLPLLDHHFKINEAYIRDLTIRLECDPQDYLKQQDPFGKYGSDRRDGSSGYKKPDRNAAPDKPKSDAPVAEKTKTEEAPVEEAKVEDAPVEETKVEETPTEEIKTDDIPSEDKPSEEEL